MICPHGIEEDGRTSEICDECAEEEEESFKAQFTAPDRAPEQKDCACKHWSAERCLELRLPNADVRGDECSCVCHEEINRRMSEDQDDDE